VLQFADDTTPHSLKDRINELGYYKFIAGQSSSKGDGVWRRCRISLLVASAFTMAKVVRDNHLYYPLSSDKQEPAFWK